MINTGIIIQTMKMLIIGISIYETNFKIVNKKVDISLISCIEIIIVILIATFFRIRISFLVGINALVFLLSMVFSYNKIGNTITVTLVSVAINYSIWFVSVIINYVINLIIFIDNDFINLIIISFVYLILLKRVWEIKKLKYGITFFRDNIQNEYIDILVLNVSTMVTLSIVMLAEENLELNMRTIPIVIISILALILTIRKIFQIYYKQKLLQKELGETKDELAARNKEIEKLEQENLNFSKISHSLAHKQKSLEHKIDELLLNSEIAGEIDVRDRLEEISKKLYKTPIVKLDKTGITQVDDMLNVMQSECIKNNIEFDLQIIGNVYHIINNIVTVDELEILIADHVKDAIIAINHTDNVNRSILVRLGKIDDCYGLYIHDSGIEFEKETLEKLGKEPITTHKSEGGTGMGFMNTFDTLKKCKGSLIINEIGKPSKDNFTKIVMIRFDGKNEFRVISYRENND